MIKIDLIITNTSSKIEIVDGDSGNKIIINNPLFQNITGESLVKEAENIFNDMESNNRQLIFNPSKSHGSIEQLFAFRAADWRKLSQQAIKTKTKKSNKFKKLFDNCKLLK